MTNEQRTQLDQLSEQLRLLEGRVSSMEMTLTRVDRILNQLLGDTH